ncbi:MAG: nucleotide exchange factor GrpE [bacterium]|nr:nucleotide exchange factor GrpE [bacterium]
MKKKKEHMDEITIPVKSLELLEEKVYSLDECMEHLKRLKAEFENYKKRHERILMENRQLFNERLIRELIPVLENLDRAMDKTSLTSLSSLSSAESFFEGVLLINSQLNDVLKKQGLTKMQTIGLPFNPVLHEALMHVASEQYPEDVIIEEVHGGYMLFDKVIKHAQVIVSKGNVQPSNA